MINVNMNSSLQGVQNWEQIASLIKSDSTSGVDGSSVSINGDSVVVSVTDASGATKAITVSVPDLGSAGGTVDQAVLQSVADKIVAIASALQTAGTEDDKASAQALQSALEELKTASARSTGPSINTTNTSKALFDLYALMALMVEVAQTQRDQSRQIRLTENQQIQNSIKQQAQSMRDAAEIALGFGIASCLISGVMSVASLYKQSAAFKQQGAATTSIDVPKQELKLAQLATDKPGALANFQKVSGATQADVKTAAHADGLDAQQQSFKTTIEATDKRIDTAMAKQKAASDQLAALEDDPQATPEAKQAAMKDFKDASDEVMRAKESRLDTERKFFDSLETRIKSNDAAIALKRDAIATKEAELKKPGVTPERSAQLKQEISTAREDVDILRSKGQYLRAYTVNQKAQYASYATTNADISAAQNKYDFAKREMELGSQFAGGQQMMNRWMGIQQVSMTISQMVNAWGNMGGEMSRAEATMEGAEQAQHNEQLDQIKDLFSQAETVVQAVIQLMQAVLSAENESLMEAIRA